jgi:transposase
MKHRRFKLTNEELQAREGAERETREALALRRLHGVRMYGSGLDMKLVKPVTGAARRTVEDWIKAYRAHGVAGLKPGGKGGNSRKLTVNERAELTNRLQHMTVEQALSQEERGERGSFWTVEAVERVVEQWYGGRYRRRES